MVVESQCLGRVDDVAIMVKLNHTAMTFNCLKLCVTKRTDRQSSMQRDLHHISSN